MADIATVSGKLTKKDLKNLTGVTRTGAVGPTTVYYAGVTAPIISAGVSAFVRGQLEQVQAISDYWLLMISALIAAIAGITWYFIFMRWSYRQQLGRGDEAVSLTEISLTDEAIHVRRNHVVTRIAWPAVQEVRPRKNFVALIIEGSDTVLIPNHWFGKDKETQASFHTAIRSRIRTES